MRADRMPSVGDVWRSRDKRDRGKTVVVLNLVSGTIPMVHVQGVQTGRRRLVRSDGWHRLYEFVSERES